jgi:hypothetical protein
LEESPVEDMAMIVEEKAVSPQDRYCRRSHALLVQLEL